jgi:KaiC/GvpD/RAD55 family RecA-like ATPase
MNLLRGLPVPIEGADTIFDGGIRLSEDSSVVAALSGTFGAGKTLFGLSLAVALAPLGCRTLFLSCEEAAADLDVRLNEAMPTRNARWDLAPFFKGLERPNPRPRGTGRQDVNEEIGNDTPSWFLARQIDLRLSTETKRLDPALALQGMLKEVIDNAEIFRPILRRDGCRLPYFSRPVIVIDGLHQLLEVSGSHVEVDMSLRSLVESCRDLGAIFIFSFSSESQELKRLEYLCDLIIELEREGFNKPGEAPRRYFQLLKARRQPAQIGSHVFHLKGAAGFRIKPSADARVREAKDEMWWDPDTKAEIFLTDDTPKGFRDCRPDGDAIIASVQNRSQILVIGKGSSGKAGFGLYLLHRRWFDPRALDDDNDGRQQSWLDDPGPPQADRMSRLRRAIYEVGLPVWHDAPYLETRVLVVSFLYQGTYYDELTRRLRRRRGSRADHGAGQGPVQNLRGLDFSPMPDRIQTETIELYPGALSVEDFIAKVEKRLWAAEASGMPFTGVLIDGLHNVFVQFPELEDESSFWGKFYNILRRRRLTVVTTHTEFDIRGRGSEGSRRDNSEGFLPYDFEQAQRKIAPLLSALVSGADYLFDLSPRWNGGQARYSLTELASIGRNFGAITYDWDKEKLRLRQAGPTKNLAQKQAPDDGFLAKAIAELLRQARG